MAKSDVSSCIEVYISDRVNFPRHDDIRVLSSQLRRAAVSFPVQSSPKAMAAQTSREFVQFLCHARGSLCEAETQIIIAGELAYITAEQEHLLIA